MYSGSGPPWTPGKTPRCSLPAIASSSQRIKPPRGRGDSCSSSADDVDIRERVRIDARGNESREVGDVREHVRAHGAGDPVAAGEVDRARVGRAADDEPRLLAAADLVHLVAVDQPVAFVDP